MLPLSVLVRAPHLRAVSGHGEVECGSLCYRVMVGVAVGRGLQLGGLPLELSAASCLPAPVQLAPSGAVRGSGAVGWILGSDTLPAALDAMRRWLGHDLPGLVPSSA